MPSTLSTVNAVFRGKYRAAAFGVWGAVISGVAAFGPLAGGALTEWVSWHWIFLVNVPVRVIVAIGGVLTVRETRRPDKLPGVDVDGAQLSAIAFGTLVFAIIEGPDLGWWKPQSSFSIFGWTWSGNAAISPVPVAHAISAVDFALSAMAIGAFFSGAAARHVAARFGAPGTVLIGLGLEVVGVLILVLLMAPDTNGWIIATQWSLVAVTAFLARGFVGALRVRLTAGEKGAPADNANFGARVNRVPN